MKNRKIAPSCDRYLYAIYSMNYLLSIYFTSMPGLGGVTRA